MVQRNFVIQQYTDYISRNGSKKIYCKNIGDKFASISSFFFDYLKEFHIPVAYFKQQDKTTLKFYNYRKYPFYIKIINVLDEKNALISGKDEGTILNLPIFEIYFNDNLVTESHLISFNLAKVEELKAINRLCSKINAVLKSFFERRNYILAEITCYFGQYGDKILLVDGLTPLSIKIKDLNVNNLNTMKLLTSAHIKKHTDNLYNLLSN